MSAVDWSRLQFATTSIYHFPVRAPDDRAGLPGRDPADPLAPQGPPRAPAADPVLRHPAGHQRRHRRGHRAGPGVPVRANWSSYSRFVGDVFGAPLALEGLAAFFLESVFLGLWLFGWDRLSKRVHLATIWAVAVGGVLSAAFIMAANSWMQRPVGYQLNAPTGPS